MCAQFVSSFFIGWIKAGFVKTLSYWLKVRMRMAELFATPQMSLYPTASSREDWQAAAVQARWRILLFIHESYFISYILYSHLFKILLYHEKPSPKKEYSALARKIPKNIQVSLNTLRGWHNIFKIFVVILNRAWQSPLFSRIDTTKSLFFHFGLI